MIIYKCESKSGLTKSGLYFGKARRPALFRYSTITAPSWASSIRKLGC